MTGADYKTKIYDLKFTAGANIRYHHYLEAKYGYQDKGIRAVVAVLAAIGLVFSIQDAPPWGFVLAIVSLITAVVLNIYLVGDWEKQHGELFRLWSDLRKDTDLEETKAESMPDDLEIPSHILERFFDLKSKAHQLHASEALTDRSLLRKCEEDEIESEWGKGIRTREQVEQELNRRETASGPTSASAV